MLKRLLALGLPLACAGLAGAANLDITADYRMRAVSYSNLDLNLNDRNNHQYISNDARLGLAVKKIALETVRGEETTMDLGLLLRALGTAGSTATLAIPLNGAANFYPSVSMVPFIENAYLRVHNLFGIPTTTTLGRQSFRLGGGLLLDDDGAGLTGAVIQGDLPWWGMKAEVFEFNDRNSNFVAANSLDLFGAALDVPTDGMWQFSQLFERDRALQPDFGCNQFNVNPAANGPQLCMISKALRSFSGAHYQISYGPLVFDGEAAIERGVATPTGITPARNHITYQGDAEVVKAKWKQHIPGLSSADSYLRMVLARGSGDKPSTTTKDEAFFPSHGHRFDGLERTGFGDFFAATPYAAFGGNYSTSTASGLSNGTSGIVTVGAGFTPPAFHGVVLDVDFFMFQADRVVTGNKSLGSEWDVRIRYPIMDHFLLAATASVFKAGTASDPGRGNSKKFTFEASGRF